MGRKGRRQGLARSDAGPRVPVIRQYFSPHFAWLHIVGYTYSVVAIKSLLANCHLPCSFRIWQLLENPPLLLPRPTRQSAIQNRKNKNHNPWSLMATKVLTRRYQNK